MTPLKQTAQEAVSRVGETIRARRAKREILRPPSCLNCGAEARRFCPECGQENTPHAVHMVDLLRDVWDEFIKADNKFFRTMIPLLFRPGFLTRQYAQGKRARYLSPFRLYLVVSALFFSVLSQQAPQLTSPSSVTLGQQIDKWRKDAEAEKPTPSKRPRASGTTTAAGSKQPRRAISVHLEGDEFKRVRTVHLWDRSIDLFTVPNTWQIYEDQQNKLAADKRDDSLTRWAVGRIITAKSFTKQSYLDHLLSMMPRLMFVMMPVFALMLKVLYRRSRLPYVVHFVLALHIHTVYFVLAAVSLLFPTPTFLELPAIAIYSFMAMKTVYGQGFAKTLLKWLLLTWNYGFALQIGALVALLLSLAF